MMTIVYLSPIITVRFALTSGKANRIESNIGARGLPSIVGERPDAATMAAKIVPSPTIHKQNLTFIFFLCNFFSKYLVKQLHRFVE
jgi:hypothetical protein